MSLSSQAAAATLSQSSASLTTLITTLQNLVTSLNNATATYLNVNGSVNSGSIIATTVVKPSAGRVVTMSILVAGTSVGVIYDSVTIGQTTKPLTLIPNQIGIITVNMPASFGITVNPGAGQQVVINYS